jgi:hypothetical protein
MYKLYRNSCEAMQNARKLLALKRAIRVHSSAIDSVTAVRLVCLAGDAVLRAPVEIAVGYGVLAKVAAAELVVWSQCGSCRKLPGHSAAVAGSCLVAEHGCLRVGAVKSCRLR